jgi:hypothetical protein
MRKNGREWTLNILQSSTPEVRENLMLLWWRAWHLRNNCIFGDGKAGISHSTDFLKSYRNMFDKKVEENNSGDTKGKTPISEIQEIIPVCKPIQDNKRWIPPDHGWQSLSVDASFIKDTNSGSWGAVIRNHQGHINLSAWGLIPICDGAESVEAIACLEGIKLGINHVDSRLIVESDCVAVINKANSVEKDRSQTSSITADIQRLASMLPDVKFRHIDREQNKLAHELARFSRVSASCNVLHGSVPPCVV